MPEDTRHRVVIAGGGIAGLEALLALADLAGDRVETTLVAPTDEFVYKPLAVEEPFAPGSVERHELKPIVEGAGARFVREQLSAVHPERGVCELGDGTSLEYDSAVICVGARPRVAFAGAETLRTSGEPIDIDTLLREAAEHPTRRLALLLPPRGSWPLPVYEFALLAMRRAQQLGLDVRPTVVTPEAAPLIVFGPGASDAVATTLKARGVEVLTGKRAEEKTPGAIVLMPGHEALDAGAAVALPALHGPAITGLPADEHGFIPIDDHCRVQGHDDVYAAGDGTNFPIKHGGLGTEQADAAAESIAAAAGAAIEAQPFRPVIRGKLITGDESLSLSAPLAGGAGEGEASLDYLWWPPHKVAGRFLAAFLAGETPREDMSPPARGVDVELELPREWYRDPMALDPYVLPRPVLHRD
jgi:sulfide:quinone oxidoreductase